MTLKYQMHATQIENKGVLVVCGLTDAMLMFCSIQQSPFQA